jgi:hypothetical protein
MKWTREKAAAQKLLKQSSERDSKSGAHDSSKQGKKKKKRKRRERDKMGERKRGTLQTHQAALYYFFLLI